MTISRRTAVTLALLLVGCRAGSPETTALVGATLHDGTGGPAIANAVVLVRDGVIACAGSASDCAVPRGAAVVDLAGKHITPGLVDAHVHVSQTGWLDGRPDGLDLRVRYPYDSVIRRAREVPQRYYESWTCAGITAAYDVGGMRWTVAQARRDATDPDAPHLAAAGPLVTHMPAHVLSSAGDSTFITLDSPAAGVAAVQRLAALGADAVKVWLIAPADSLWPVIEARFTALAAAARRQSLPLIVHATSLREAKVAVREGAHMLVHSVDSERVDSAFIADVVTRGTIYVPTLRVAGNWTTAYFAAATGEAPAVSDPLGCVDADTRARIAEAPSLTALVPDRPRVLGFRALAATRQARDDSVMAANLRTLFAAGATIAVGTDAGNPLTLHGASIHDELAALESVGIPAESVVVMATRNGARAMRRSDIGTVEAGRSADLLTLRDDPRTTVAAFLTREGVMLKGRWVRAPERPSAASTSAAKR